MKDRNDFFLYGVFVREGKRAVKKKMSEEGWTFPALLDTRKSVASKYGIPGHPATFLIDREGRIAVVAIGARKWDGDSARALLDDLLSE